MDTVSKNFEKPAVIINPLTDPPLRKEKALASAPISKNSTESEDTTKDRLFPKNFKGNGPKLPLVSRSTNEGEFHSNRGSKPTPRKVKKFSKRVRSDAGTDVAPLPIKKQCGNKERV